MVPYHTIPACLLKISCVDNRKKWCLAQAGTGGDAPENQCLGLEKKTCRRILGCTFASKTCWPSDADILEDKCFGLKKRACHNTPGCDYARHKLLNKLLQNSPRLQVSAQGSEERSAKRNAPTCKFDRGQCVPDPASRAGSNPDLPPAAQNMCQGLRKRRCKRNPDCDNDGSQCVVGETPPELPAATGHRCQGLRKRKCKKREGCDYNGNQCVVGETPRTTADPTVVSSTQGPPPESTTSEAPPPPPPLPTESTTNTQAPSPAATCTGLNRGRCLNTEGCTYDGSTCVETSAVAFNACIGLKPRPMQKEG